MHYLFLDESGDHSLTRIDPGYPVFVLGGIIVAGDEALRKLEKSVAAFKRDLFRNPDLVLHTADITRNTPLGRWIAEMPPKPDLDIIRRKLRRGPKGAWEGAGLVVLPKGNGRGPLRNTRPR